MFILFILASYTIGSIPFGLILGKLKGVDVRKVGSGNIGATNVHRALGIKYASLVALLDLLKGVLPVYIALSMHAGQLLISLVALATVIGHVFPIFLKFKGGKGAATYAGTLIFILGIKLFVIVAIIWFGVLFITRVMSLTNLTLSFVLPPIFLFIMGSEAYFLYSLVACALIWYSHRENIQRLIKGKENKINFPKRI